MKFSILGAFLIFVAVIAFTCSSCYTNKSEGMKKTELPEGEINSIDGRNVG